ncbi:MAG: class I SAM-dependent methyltransferase [Leptolyngbya sp. SIO1D8]|nr:class I SAM-dependent methyltransferase [Leptolyngbya sp. SIO1D8]
MKTNLQARLQREKQHGRTIIATEEKNWGWNTPAGHIRWQRRLDYLAGTLADKSGTVLEIGVGSGTFTPALAEVFPNLVGVDISEDLLDIASRKAPTAKLYCMDAHNLDFPDNSFEAIVGCSVLHHLDWNLAVSSFYQKLKSGGAIRFSEPNLLNPQIFLQKNIPPLKKYLGDSPDEYAFTKWQIQRSLMRAGFTDIKVTPYEFLHPSTPKHWISNIIKLENFLSRTPLGHIGGSLLIEAKRS